MLPVTARMIRAAKMPPVIRAWARRLSIASRCPPRCCCWTTIGYISSAYGQTRWHAGKNVRQQPAAFGATPGGSGLARPAALKPSGNYQGSAAAAAVACRLAGFRGVGPLFFGSGAIVSILLDRASGQPWRLPLQPRTFASTHRHIALVAERVDAGLDACGSMESSASSPLLSRRRRYRGDGGAAFRDGRDIARSLVSAPSAYCCLARRKPCGAVVDHGRTHGEPVLVAAGDRTLCHEYPALPCAHDAGRAEPHRVLRGMDGAPWL